MGQGCCAAGWIIRHGPNQNRDQVIDPRGSLQHRTWRGCADLDWPFSVEYTAKMFRQVVGEKWLVGAQARSGLG
jgi:hypothetical protein